MHSHTYIHALMLSIEYQFSAWGFKLPPWWGKCPEVRRVPRPPALQGAPGHRGVEKDVLCAAELRSPMVEIYGIFLRKTLPHFMNWMNWLWVHVDKHGWNEWYMRFWNHQTWINRVKASQVGSWTKHRNVDTFSSSPPKYGGLKQQQIVHFVL